MNLIIKQNKQITEQVTSDLIDTLYNLTKPDASTGQPAANAVLVGSLQAIAAYKDAVDFLNEQFSSAQDNGSDLQITVLDNNYYIRFADPEVVRVLVSKGVMEENESLTAAQAAQVKWTDSWFKNNSLIRTFDEIKYFTGLLQQNHNGFTRTEQTFNGSSLTCVDLRDLEYLSYYEFASCANLNRFQGINGPVGELNLPKLKGFASGTSTMESSTNAFYNCPGIVKIVSLGTIIDIRHRTFFNCSNLIEANIPTECIRINAGAFKSCSQLETINISHINYIDNECFSGCSSLKYFDGPESTQGELNLPFLLGTLGSSAFKDCSKLTSVTSLGSISSIREAAFQNCTLLRSINMSNIISTIGYCAFENCANLEYYHGTNSTAGEINLPNLTGTLGYRAFYGCTKLASITSLGSITEIGYRAFENCSSLTNINFPSTIEKIGDNAFTGTPWYNSQPNGPIIISNKVFYKHKGNVGGDYSIPEGVIYISKWAFDGDTSLTGLHIPASMAEFGDARETVSGCDNLQTVTVDANNTVFDSRDNCNAVIRTSTNELLFGGKMASIPNTVTKIGANAFNGKNLTGDLTIPSSITSIGDSAFRGCGSSQDTLTLYYANTDAFNMVKYGNIIVKGSAGVMGGNFMHNNANVSNGFTITIEEGITSIGYAAFTWSKPLNDIVVPSTVTSLSSYCFHYNTSVAVIFTSPTPPSSINNNAFKANQTVKVPQGSLAAYQSALSSQQNYATLTIVEYTA